MPSHFFVFSELDDFLMRALLGSRKTDAKIQALNVLTIVNRVAKKTAFFRTSTRFPSSRIPIGLEC